MALMFPRLARNFARNGYFPTDEATLERALQALEPALHTMTIIDPCAGEGVAIAEAAHALGRASVYAYAVEYDEERAAHASTLVEHCLRSDLMDTVISRQSFGLLWLNPPYGDLMKDPAGGGEFKGRARLEKLFYQRSLPFLQYEGVLVYIIPHYTLDSELVGWLTRHFTDLSVFAAADPQFKQVVVFGRRVRQRDLPSPMIADQLAAEHHVERSYLLDVGRGAEEAPPLPSTWPYQRYRVPPATDVPEHFYRTTLEPEQFASEVHRLRGLWSAADTHLGASQRPWRRPARALSNWHLSLSLAAGAISGVVTAPSGRVLVVKGDTHKEKSLTTEYTEGEDGSVNETRILTDRFVPVIRAWDMTPNSATRGQVLCFRPETVRHPRSKVTLAHVPSIFASDALMPKERELIAICKEAKAEGRKVLAYTTYTGTRDTTSRLKVLMEQAGFKTAVLRSHIDASRREDWIAEQLDRGIDVLITNPELVKTGMDLLEFTTIVFMQSGWNTYTLLQAARRSWRIGQKHAVKVIFLAYAETSQITCLQLMGKKITVAQSTSGDAPDCGLDVLNQDGDSVEIELARRLAA